jgi:hypothetical protein
LLSWTRQFISLNKYNTITLTIEDNLQCYLTMFCFKIRSQNLDWVCSWVRLSEMRRILNVVKKSLMNLKANLNMEGLNNISAINTLSQHWSMLFNIISWMWRCHRTIGSRERFSFIWGIFMTWFFRQETFHLLNSSMVNVRVSTIKHLTLIKRPFHPTQWQ